MKHRLIIALQAALLVVGPPAASAQQELLKDPEIYERTHFDGRCKVAEYGPDFITRIDINNDGLTDVVANDGAITCDGVRGPACTEEGCPYNFYLQVKEGGYFMIATAMMYSYDFVQRFGNMVFVMQMHPKYCNRTDSKPCEMTVRVRGTKFLTISAK